MTLADIRPLMTETVEHWHPPAHNLFGKAERADSTYHPARVIYSPVRTYAPASRELTPDAAAIVWLIDHPHPIAIGDTFGLPDGTALKAARIERRTILGGVLSKVHLS